tara:strand:+ start:85043 stop:86080 length:1038 start_codon:yes stop_codon:yes gene_type:complete
MKQFPTYFTDEEQLEEALSRPSTALVEMMRELDGDFILLGVAGKMGVSMAYMAKRACVVAGVNKRIIGVSRFSDHQQRVFLEKRGIEIFQGDLLDTIFIHSLPDVKNVIYLAGMKFGTDGNESFTWAMNAFLPGMVTEKFKKSRIVAFSTGCVYPLIGIGSGGSLEEDNPQPIGEYAQSCLGRERMFEYGSKKYKTPVILIRLNYAVEMRYGVLVDIAQKVLKEETIDITMGHANVIWQGDANDMILRSIQYCASPAQKLNISGAEIISVVKIAQQFGELMGKEVRFSGKEADSALLVNVSKSHSLLGTPKMDIDQIVKWTANWVGTKKRLLGKSTHFEVRDGKY